MCKKNCKETVDSDEWVWMCVCLCQMLYLKCCFSFIPAFKIKGIRSQPSYCRHSLKCPNYVHLIYIEPDWIWLLSDLNFTPHCLSTTSALQNACQRTTGRQDLAGRVEIYTLWVVKDLCYYTMFKYLKASINLTLPSSTTIYVPWAIHLTSGCSRRIVPVLSVQDNKSALPPAPFFNLQ